MWRTSAAVFIFGRTGWIVLENLSFFDTNTDYPNWVRWLSLASHLETVDVLRSI